MTRRKKKWIGVAVLLALAALVGVVVASRRNADVARVEAEVLRTRELVAIVTASGEIQPEVSVDVHANATGRVDRVAVREGQTVEEGQFLLQIDPVSAEAASQGQAAQVQAEQRATEALRIDLEQARRDLGRARELASKDLISREELQRAESDVARLEAQIRGAEARTDLARAALRSSRHQLAQVTVTAPMAGVVTRLDVEQGESAFTGFSPTLLLTIADLSTMEAEVKVDETDVVNVKLGQAAEVTVDAFPDSTFAGQVTEVGTSPILPAEGEAAEDAKDFEVVVTLDRPLPAARAGLSATADIETARRPAVTALPIQALVVRELPRPRLAEAPPDTLGPGEETEGVFVIRDGRARFAPVAVGIAGDRFFEVLSGVQPGDSVVTGPYELLREIADGDRVRVQEPDEEDEERGAPRAGLEDE
ncbi:MAG: efflux RND transporter periplasmic adaptor subunit [Gemmatimonadota bacterium]